MPCIQEYITMTLLWNRKRQFTSLSWHCSETGRGSLLPRPLPVAGMTLLTVRVEQIGLKDASQFIDPFFTVSVKGDCEPFLHYSLTVTVSSDIFHFICFWWWVLCIPTLCGRWALLKSSLLLWWFMVVRVVFAVVNNIIFVMIMMVMTMKIGSDINKLRFWWWLLLMIMIWIYFDDGHDDDDWKCSKMIVIYFWLWHGSDGDDNELLTTCSNKASQS